MKILSALTPELTAWARRQPLFFVASAPRHGAHVNVSPKGQASASLAFLGPSRVAYVDRTGSGCETAAHLYENGRATVLFVSVGAAPRLLRLFCVGRVVEWDDPALAAWLSRMACPRPAAVRAVVVLDVWRVTTSCGYGVPRVRPALYASVAKEEEEEEREGAEETAWLGGGEWSVFEHRSTLDDWARQKEKEGGVLEYQAKNNTQSLDGLPGLRVARRAAGQRLWVGDVRARIRRVLHERDGICLGFGLAIALYLVTALLSGFPIRSENMDMLWDHVRRVTAR